MKTLPDILFYLSMLLLVALGIYSQFYFLAILAGGILVSILLVKLYSNYWNSERIRKESKLEGSKTLTKKYRAAKLNRTLPFKAGLLIALASVFSAFTYTSSYVKPPSPKPEEIVDDPIFVMDELIIEEKKEVKIAKVKPKKKVRKVVERVVTVPDTKPVQRMEATFLEPTTPIDNIIKSTETKRVLTIPKAKPIKSEYGAFELDHMARFSGCEDETLTNIEIKSCADEALRAFFAKNIKYPPLARENGIEGRVGVSFIISATGKIEDIQIVKDPGLKKGYEGLGKEVSRAVTRMPDWVPGRQGGKAVRVKFYTSVKFQLE